MPNASSHKLATIVCCIVAVATLVAAGVMLLDVRDDLRPAGGEIDDFTAFQTAQSVEPAAEALDWQEVAGDEEWEILKPVQVDDPSQSELDDDNEPTSQSESSTQAIEIADSSQPAGNRRFTGPTGRIVVVTNFTRAEVHINGDRYPTYSDDGENRGMELPANQTHQVLVEFDGNEQLYEIDLRPGERRLLMIELTGLGEGRPVAQEPPSRQRRERPTSDQEDDEEIEDGEGRITVYSRPRGEIYVGEQSTGEQTPGTVTVEPGRHEVQVEYRAGEMSETKTVRVREGSRVKLFFRESD